MPTAIRLIEAKPSDLPRVLEMARRAIDAIRPGAYTARELAIWRERPAGQLEELLASGRYHLAMAGPLLLGSAGWKPGKDVDGIVRAVFVAPEAQGRRVGARLIGAIEDEMREAGLPLSRIPAALCARRFYEKLGYACERVEYGELPGGKIPFVWMSCMLGAAQRRAA
jgi:GNAT superfamily N-acetyltransferase